MRIMIFAILLGCIDGCPMTCCSMAPHPSHKPDATVAPEPPESSNPDGRSHP